MPGQTFSRLLSWAEKLPAERGYRFKEAQRGSEVGMFTSRHVCVINGGKALTDKNEVEGAYQNLPKLFINPGV